MTWSTLIVRWLVACATAIALYSTLYPLGNLPVIGSVEEQTADIRSKLTLNYLSAPSEVPPLIFVDVDQASYARLGWPTTFPRAPLATLLRDIARAKPAIIILDIDIGWPGDTEGSEILASALAELGGGPIPILLARSLLQQGGSNQSEVLRPTPFDTTVLATRSLSWVIADARRSSDGIVRQARSWVVHCKEGRQQAILSAALAAWIILKSPGELKPDVGARDRLPCSSIPTDLRATSPESLSVQVGGNTRRLSLREMSNIDYTIGWNIEGGQRRQSAFHQGREVPLLTTLPILPLLGGHDVDYSVFSNRVVLIGSSAAEQRDLHVTPVGLMPGPIIIANQFVANFWSYWGDTYWFGFVLVIVLATAIAFCVWAIELTFGSRYLGRFPIASSHTQAALVAVLTFMLFRVLPGPTTEFVFLLTSYVVSVALALTAGDTDVSARN